MGVWSRNRGPKQGMAQAGLERFPSAQGSRRGPGHCVRWREAGNRRHHDGLRRSYQGSRSATCTPASGQRTDTRPRPAEERNEGDRRNAGGGALLHSRPLLDWFLSYERDTITARRRANRWSPRRRSLRSLGQATTGSQDHEQPAAMRGPPLSPRDANYCGVTGAYGAGRRSKKWGAYTREWFYCPTVRQYITRSSTEASAGQPMRLVQPIFRSCQ
jgi:hypothetical protein